MIHFPTDFMNGFWYIEEIILCMSSVILEELAGLILLSCRYLSFCTTFRSTKFSGSNFCNFFLMIQGFKSCFSPSAMVDFCAKVTLLYDWVVCLARPCGMSPGLFPMYSKIYINWMSSWFGKFWNQLTLLW